MKEADQKRFAELITGLAQTFATDISPQDLENYWKFLRNYPLDQIEQAVIDYCISPEGHRFMPKPGELVASFQGKQSEQSLRAWIKILKAMRQTGVYKSVIFDDAIIHAVISDMGGWIRLCHLTERELTFQQREFERLYAFYLQHPPRDYPRQLSGIINATNAAAGYGAQQPPVLIGETARAALVYQNGRDTVGLPTQSLSVQQILHLAKTKSLQLDADQPPPQLPAKKNPFPGEHNDG